MIRRDPRGHFSITVSGPLRRPSANKPDLALDQSDFPLRDVFNNNVDALWPVTGARDDGQECGRY
jgi:hypothetical protein